MEICDNFFFILFHKEKKPCEAGAELLKGQTVLLNDPLNEMDANPFEDPTDSDIEDANVFFNLLDEDAEDDDFVDVDL